MSHIIVNLESKLFGDLNTIIRTNEVLSVQYNPGDRYIEIRFLNESIQGIIKDEKFHFNEIVNSVCNDEPLEIDIDYRHRR